MKLTIQTPKGPYQYKLKIVYSGIKRINKEIAKENLLLFNKIAHKNGLKFGLVYGTLLGALREKDFISHDEDIDLFIMREDLNLFKSMLFELRKQGFEVIRYDRRDGLCSLMRKGEYIDFYIFSPLIDNVYETLGDPMPGKYITDLVEIDFQGEKFLTARNAEESMMFFYGEDWQTPIETKLYDMSKMQRFRAILNWWFYYSMPNFIFYPIMKRRAVKKIKRYNYRANMLNKLMGYNILKDLPLNCYRIKNNQCSNTL